MLSEVGSKLALHRSNRVWRWSRACKPARCAVMRPVPIFANLCNDRFMAGRPKSDPDPLFAAFIGETCSSLGISISSLAREIGVMPSTLSRSMRDRRFSRGLKAKLELHLTQRPLAARSDRGGHSALIQALHLLQELCRLLPSLEKQIASALDQQARLGQRTD